MNDLFNDNNYNGENYNEKPNNSFGPENVDKNSSSDAWSNSFETGSTNKTTPQGVWTSPYSNNQGIPSEQLNYTYPNEPRYPEEDHYNDYRFNSPYQNSDNSKHNKQNKSNFKNLLAVIAVVASVSAIGLCSYTAYNEFSRIKNNNGIAANSSQSSQDGTNPNFNPLVLNKLTGDEEGIPAQQIYQDAVKSTVGIVVYDLSSEIPGKSSGQGTGVIISSDGYIVTNSHVVGNTKNANVSVVLSDNKEVEGKVVGFDTKTDLAVIKIEANNLQPVEFGDSDQVAVGSWVLAIGNPAGLDFQNSLTRGIVSAVNRSFGTPNLVNYIQTDAAINPGNSGGPLIDMYGRVVGINSSKIVAQGFEGMGFSIPSKIVKSVVDDIIKQGYVSGRVSLGASYKNISSVASSMYNVPQGVLINKILPESDLSSKGVRMGDIILKINDKSVNSTTSLLNELSNKSVGEEVTLTIYRANTRSIFSMDSSTFDVKVKLIEDKGEIDDGDYEKRDLR